MQETKLIDEEEHTRDSIVVKYNDLVYQVANRLSRDDFHFREDLVQEGFIGLIEAFDRFDSSKDVKFITYAYRYVQGFVARGFDKRTLIHTPAVVIRTAWKIQRSDLWELSDSELAEKFEKTLHHIQSCRIYFNTQKVASMDKEAFGKTEEGTLYHILSKDDDLTSIVIQDYCSRMNDREKLIVQKLASGYSQAEIAKHLGLSKQRIGQLTAKIKTKIELALRAR